MVALVLGGADSLWDDVEEALLLCHHSPEIVAVNNAGCVWPYALQHWATLHSAELPARIRKRDYHTGGYRPVEYTTWGPPPPRGVDARTDCTLDGWGEGSSGLFGVGVALQVADLAILCGIPMDDRPHFDRITGWDPDPYWAEWERRAPELQDRVRSMSGRTKELLGPPTREWITTTRSTT